MIQVNKIFKLSFLVAIGFGLWSCSVRDRNEENEMNPMKLWYENPAQVWEEALPLGNGRLGAMVFGSTGTEQIQLNEETVWAGEPGNNLPKGFKEILPEVRKLIFQGKYKEAEALTMTRIPRHAPEWNNYGMPYQTVGDLLIHFPGHEHYTSYYRELNIENATSSTTYEVDGVTYKREYFISAPDQIMLIRLSASEPGKISCDIDATTPHTVFSKKVEGKKLILSGKSEDADDKTGKVDFATEVQPVLVGGTLTDDGEKLTIQDADTLTLFVSIGTNFINYKDISGDAFAKAESYLKPAIKKDYSSVKSDHIKDFRSYFDRVTLDLGATDSIKNPTDQRIKDFNSGNDPQLVALYFQFGRYLLISSSRPGTQPANLQGIWNDKLSPPWDSKYTININTEMNYWPSEITNLPEMSEPLFAMVEDLSVTGHEAAEKMYGARGWVTHHNTDIWRITGPVDGAFYGMWPMGGAWLSQHLWQHFLFNGDTAFLKKVYPVLKGSAMYYVDVLQKEPTHGWMVVAPCMSPENRHPGGASMAAGNTMDNQLVFDVFSNLMHAAKILNVDKSFADTVNTLFKQLPPMQIGQFDQLQEWLQDWDRKDDHHRHVSHLYGLFPGSQISPFRTPELFRAAENSLIYRGDKSTGWSMGWKVNLWARLLDGNRAYKLIQDQLTPAPEEKSGQNGGTYPNLFDAHPPFQIDGNFGCTSGIAEMLVQSYDGDIFVLPALPDAWPEGSVKGLRTRGGYTIDLVWKNKKISKLTIYSALGGNCRIRVANALKGNVELKPVEPGTPNPNPLFYTENVKQPLISEKADLQGLQIPQTSLFDFETAKNGVYNFTSIIN
ncbi:glycoside hydrolase N-terminal domain-containing protein [Saccharicrinis sp. FJH2]|uniref:glycoside hydrolase family 95 protein n=1 Tax=Saccharicrinis sp. FJH65 TaxID=3344659 RepID=UPI0035F3E116